MYCFMYYFFFLYHIFIFKGIGEHELLIKDSLSCLVNISEIDIDDLASVSKNIFI